MVHRGPSQGCRLCRKRKIKCDLGKPECMRCGKIGAICPGYRDVQATLFRPYSRSNGKSSRSRSGSVSYQSSRAQTTSTRGSPSQALEAHVGTNHLPSTPDTAGMRDSFAICFFLQQYTSGEKIFYSCVLQGWFDFVPRILDTGDCLCLLSAIEAVSWSHLAQQTGTNWALIASKKAYSTAVDRVNQALSQTETAIKDDTCAATLILGLHDNRVGDPSYMTSHLDGCIALLRLRKTQRIQNPEIEQSLYLHMRCLSRVRELEHGYTPFLDEWEKEYPLRKGMPTPDWASTVIARFRERVSRGQDMANLLEEGKFIDSKLQEMPSNCGSSRSRQVSDPRPRGYLDKPLLVYQNTKEFLSNQYMRACRIYVLETIHAIALAMSEDISEDVEAIPGTCRMLIDEILVSMPFAFDEVDGNGKYCKHDASKSVVKAFFSTLWLRTAKGCPFATTAQVRHVVEAQNQAASMMGYEMRPSLAFTRQLWISR